MEQQTNRVYHLLKFRIWELHLMAEGQQMEEWSFLWFSHVHPVQFWVLALWTVRRCEALPFLVRCTCVHKKGVTAGAYMVSLSTLQTIDIIQSTYVGIWWTWMVSVTHGNNLRILTPEHVSFPLFSRVLPAEWRNGGMAEWRNGNTRKVSPQVNLWSVLVPYKRSTYYNQPMQASDECG